VTLFGVRRDSRSKFGYDALTSMTQSIIIFVIILLMQVIAAATAKKKANEKKAFLESQRLGQSPPISPISRSMQRPAQVAPRRDRFVAAQVKAERTSAARALPSARKAMPRSQQTFTSQVGSVRVVPKIADLGAAQKRARREATDRRPEFRPQEFRPREPDATRQSFLRSTEEGEATSAQLAKTVDAIRRGILPKSKIAVDPKFDPSIARPKTAADGFRAILHSRQHLRTSIVLAEILGPPVALR